MAERRVSDEALDNLRRLAAATTPAPWKSMIEGRDHVSGDSFIMVGTDESRGDDLYLITDSGLPPPADQDFVAAARNNIDALLAEIDRLRGELDQLRSKRTG